VFPGRKNDRVSGDATHRVAQITGERKFPDGFGDEDFAQGQATGRRTEEIFQKVLRKISLRFF
jgi:hypothetical protein